MQKKEKHMNKGGEESRREGCLEKTQKAPYPNRQSFHIFIFISSAVIIEQITEVFEQKLVTEKSGNTF